MSLAAQLEDDYRQQCYWDLKDAICSNDWCATKISAAMAKYVDGIRSLCTQAHWQQALNYYKRACLKGSKGEAVTYDSVKVRMPPNYWQSTITFIYAAGKPTFTSDVMRTKALAEQHAAQLGVTALTEEITSTVFYALVQTQLKHRKKYEDYMTSKGKPIPHLSPRDVLQQAAKELALPRTAAMPSSMQPERELALPRTAAMPSSMQPERELALPRTAAMPSSMQTETSYTGAVPVGFGWSPSLVDLFVNENEKRVAEQAHENSAKKMKTLLDHVLSQQKQKMAYKEKIEGLVLAKTDAEIKAADAEKRAEEKAVEAARMDTQFHEQATKAFVAEQKAADAEKKAAKERRKRAEAERKAAEAAQKEAELRDQGKAFEEILERNRQEFTKLMRENQQLRDRPSGSREERVCRICLIKPADHAMLPCGHVCACEACAPRLCSDAQRAVCPICRHGIARISRVYF
eukprot:TRINITY_DN8119_c0_g1_i1.p1 TRINITY_DN8119_c0_g1~~TRINITY_DN8119_c0_g1_i1.p1  ORF type:complete len:462 (+),score=108.43 TRINITY_DN8119_c0_g1_i1:45-1430(+)